MESRQDPETLALLQQIFNDAVFYSFNANEEIYTIYNSSRHKLGYAMTVTVLDTTDLKRNKLGGWNLKCRDLLKSLKKG